MRILAIGDLHGKKCWQSIDAALYDHIIFIGDYVDGVDMEPDAMVRNLENIIAFRKEFSSKVVLLLGNHDIQYLAYPRERCSRFDSLLQPRLTSLFNANRYLFKVAWQYDRYLFTHAGLSRKYLQWLRERLEGNSIEFDPSTPAHYLNLIHESDPHLIYVCGARRGGFYPHGGPLWADASETEMDYLEGFHHVVGHTKLYKMDTYQRPGEESSITYIDVLNSREEFYVLDTGLAKG